MDEKVNIGLDLFPREAGIHIWYAFLLNEKLDNRYKALVEMMKAEDLKMSI